MNHSEAIDTIAAALSKAQGEIKPALKDSTNPHFKSHYADLASVWAACRKALSDHGLSVVQDAVTLEAGVAVVTRLLHASGQWIEFGPLVVPAQKNDAHGVGSAISYGKRYALSAALGIVGEEDDDGNEAAQPKPRAERAPRAARSTNGMTGDAMHDAKLAFFRIYQVAAKRGVYTGRETSIDADKFKMLSDLIARPVTADDLNVSEWMAAAQELKSRLADAEQVPL